MPPSNVSTGVLNSTAINVSWGSIPEIDRNGIITHYEVEYTSTISSPVYTTVLESPLLITGLEEYIEYTISVRGYTAVGAGPFSQAVTNTTLEDGLFTKHDYIIHSTLHSGCV